MPLILPRLVSCVWLGIIASSAYAAPTYFINDPVADRAAFEAAVDFDLALESFEDPSFSSATSVDFPVGGTPAFNVTSNQNLFSGTFFRGLSDGTRSLGVNENPQTTLTFQFVTPINAFGIDANDLSFVDMTFSDDLGNVFNDVLLGDDGSPAGGPGFENRQFFGVLNPIAFTTVELRFSEASDSGSLFFDKLQYGTIPEPTSLAAGIALCVVGCLFSRQARCV